jgi:hypothetical protein
MAASRVLVFGVLTLCLNLVESLEQQPLHLIKDASNAAGQQCTEGTQGTTCPSGLNDAMVRSVLTRAKTTNMNPYKFHALLTVTPLYVLCWIT